MVLSLFGGSTVRVSAQTAKIKVVDGPDRHVRSTNYINSRAPLQQVAFMKLPVGSIRPAGWLGRYLELQRDGLTGHLGEISAWLDKNNNAWLTNGGDHGWEEVPYWLKGYSSLAYILGDKKMIAETKTWIEAVFKSQRADGSFGPVNLSNGKPELWAQMIMLTTLQSYYEYTGDRRVIDLMTKYFKWELSLPDDHFLEDYWEKSRGGDNLYTVLWLYNRTGNTFLLDLARKIHRNTADWCQASTLPNWHNVNIAECFREPATYYMLTGEKVFLDASYNDQQLIRRTFGQVPGGMFGADENARMGYIDPRQGVETCGMVEQMASDEIMLRFTGDTYWADNCEDVAFNTYPAAVMPDFKALRYITSPNMVQSDSKNHHPGIDNSGPFLSMNPFSSRCCQHNHSQGWPYYSENLIYATPDNGVAMALYAACEAEVKVEGNKKVTITETTDYPFSDKIRFTISKGGGRFPIYLRIPSWTNNAEVSINGVKQNAELVSGKYIRMVYNWKKGDVITLHVPMALHIRRWQVNKNSASIDYGPLTLSLKIKERYVQRSSTETAIGDSKWQKNADASQWPAWEIYADSPWNYALLVAPNSSLGIFEILKKPMPADNFPFSLENVPLEFRAKGRRIPSWKIDETGLCGVLPAEDAVKSDTLETITLVPMGAARLRISAFPVAKK
ncbi:MULTISPECIES: beta-L-arabinofuranosidase domain-containing protein [Prevotellaceae]|uniref:beta-L-arabinofuranosidase domain-containing protein n=1 Tax=Prevotellaceae TaxID=171552 RepID=UPI00040D91E8|nr:beta-L-arabinofuranosidase domain-containing protein [Prevotella phocaeensis]